MRHEPNKFSGHSVTLCGIIRDRIAARPEQAIPFREFMELCLYHPKYGYYMQERTKLGKQGDFYTSAYVGNVLGDMLAERMIRWANEQASGGMLTMVEWGGGDGKLAKQVIERVRTRDQKLYERTRWMMIEHSPYHRMLQRASLDGYPVRWLTEEEWRNEMPWRDIYVWANELLDALPVHRVKQSGGVVYEIWVTWDEAAARFAEVLMPVSGEVAAYMADQRITLADGQIGELNLAAVNWIAGLGRDIAAGMVTLIDYGDLADEIYASHRMQGTLMCYRRHLATDDPYVHVGDQDITAHVDFTACMRAAFDAGFDQVRMQSQAEYLVDGGVLEWLQEHHDPDPFSPAARRNRSIRQLLLSDQMSELFKVMTATKRR